MNDRISFSAYENIDPFLSAWAARKSLTWLTDHKDTEVRTFFLGTDVDRVQVSVEYPHEYGLQIRVGRYLPGKYRGYSAQFDCRFGELDETLDVAFETALIWSQRNGKG
jgi:hypothetical protein